MQNNSNPEAESAWLGVIARSLAFLCLKEADMRDQNIAAQAQFLESLGLCRKDCALLLGTSEASLRELQRLASQKRKNNGAKKKKPK